MCFVNLFYIQRMISVIYTNIFAIGFGNIAAHIWEDREYFTGHSGLALDAPVKDSATLTMSAVNHANESQKLAVIIHIRRFDSRT